MLQGSQGNDILNYNLTDIKMANIGNITQEAYDNRWTPENAANAKWPKATAGYTRAWLLSDRYVEDGSYLRMKYITLSYNWLHPFHFTGIDHDYISGPDWSMSSLGAGNFQGDASVVDALWNGCYGLINRANEAERHIEAMTDLSEAFRNNAIGEVKFQKAFCYFLLVRAYGPVPIQDEQEGGEQSKPRVAVDSVYNYITKNLEEAASMMYKNTDSNYKAGHVNAGSAAGLLAKVYATEASAAMPAGTKVTVPD